MLVSLFLTLKVHGIHLHHVHHQIIVTVIIRMQNLPLPSPQVISASGLSSVPPPSPTIMLSNGDWPSLISYSSMLTKPKPSFTTY